MERSWLSESVLLLGCRLQPSHVHTYMCTHMHVHTYPPQFPKLHVTLGSHHLRQLAEGRGLLAETEWALFFIEGHGGEDTHHKVSKDTGLKVRSVMAGREAPS